MTSSAFDYQKLIIIGAARSGTNMLRDALTRMEYFGTWPCDEINYIWRHGNRDLPTDEFESSDARPEVVEFVRAQFDRMATNLKDTDKPELSVLVEKTCANSLRVPFVDRVFPEARYIYIVRDGRDVIASAAKRWKAPLDIQYIAAKARFIPIVDMPFYASKYLANRLEKLLNKESRLSVWGPRFVGMDSLGKTVSVEELSAYQWARSVARSDEALSAIREDRVHFLRYEDFVYDPANQLERICSWLGISVNIEQCIEIATDIRRDSVGKGGAGMQSSNPRLSTILNPLLHRHGYI